MNDVELKAYGELAQAIANHAFASATYDNEEHTKRFPGVQLPIYYHLSSSTFEETAKNLWDLKILKPVDEVKQGWAFFFSFNCDLNSARDVAIENSLNGPSLEKLLYNFVDLFGEYGSKYWGFAVETEIGFGKGGRLEHVFDALVPLGYLQKMDDGFVWTELAAPVMIKAGFWDDDEE